LEKLGYTLRKNRDKCEDERTNRAHSDIRWQQVPRLKKLWAMRSTTQAASTESVSLRRLVGGVARGPLWRGTRLEAIGPIGQGPALTIAVFVKW